MNILKILPAKEEFDFFDAKASQWERVIPKSQAELEIFHFKSWYFSNPPAATEWLGPDGGGGDAGSYWQQEL